MALPNQLKSARLTDSSPGNTIDNGLGDAEKAVCDILGIPVDTNISAALFEIVAAGLKSIIMQDAAADPGAVGVLRRNGAALKFHNGSAVKTIAWTSDVPAAFGGNFSDLAGQIALGQIPDRIVTVAKMQDISTGYLLGRSAAGFGVIEGILVGSGLSMSGGVITAPAQAPIAPQRATFSLSIDTGETTNSLNRIYIVSNTTNAITVRVSVTGFTGGSGGKGGSPSSTHTVNDDHTITHNIGRVQNVTPSLAISSLGNPFTGTLTVDYS